jgi:sulfopyruvate decarboxylase subunit alpha
MTQATSPCGPHRPSAVLETLRKLGFSVAVSVPDSWLGEILVRIEKKDDMTLIRATHEEEALAIACGSRLGGARTVMLIQNAGLLSMGAGLVSLAQRYQFPVLILASYRGTVEDPVFYHIPKGLVTEPVLDGLRLPFSRIDPDHDIAPQIARAAAFAEEGNCPYVLLMSKEDIQW